MKKECLIEAYEFLKMSHGVFKKLLVKFTDDQLNYRPAEGTRSIKELVAHIYGAAKGLKFSIETGGMSQEQSDMFEKAEFSTVEELLIMTDESFNDIYNFMMSLSDKELEKDINVFYGTFKASQMLGFFHIEHIHHYAQLTVYARLLGIEPPFAYGFDE